MQDKLHHSMAEVERDYSATYSTFMKAAAVGIVGAVVYFFALAVYLGGWGHTDGDDFVRTFAADGRIEMEYKGTKLPMYENPAMMLKPKLKPSMAPISGAEAEPEAVPAAAPMPTAAGGH